MDDEQSATVKKQSNKMLYLIGLVVLVVIGVGAFLALSLSKTQTPESVFADALNNSLSLEQTVYDVNLSSDSLTADIQAGGNYAEDEQSIAGEGTLDVSLSDPSVGDMAMKASMRFVNNMTFMRFDSIEVDGEFGDLVESFFEPVIGTWVKQDDSGGEDEDTPIGDLALTIIPLANVDGDQRGQIISTINDNNIYEYDPDEVTSEEVDGVDTYKYQLRVSRDNLSKLLEYFPDEDIGELFGEQDPILVAVWIDKESAQIVRVTYEAPISFGADLTGENESVLVDVRITYGTTLTVEEPEEWITEEEQAELTGGF